MPEASLDGREPRIVYEDGDVLIVDKPANMHSAGLASSGSAVLSEWVFARRPEIAAVPGRGFGEGGLVHRLDRATSGLVAFAKSQAAFERFAQASAQGAFIKRYEALCEISASPLPGCRPGEGCPSGVGPSAWKAALAAAKAGDYSGLSRAPWSVECRFRAYGPGRRAVACAMADKASGGEWTARLYGTTIDALEPNWGEERSIAALKASVTIVRGFRHQIRATLAWLGLPIAGDTRYGAPPAARLYLHARELSFPEGEGERTVRSPGPFWLVCPSERYTVL